MARSGRAARAAAFALLALGVAGCRPSRRDVPDAGAQGGAGASGEATPDDASGPAHAAPVFEAGPADDAIPVPSEELAQRARHLLEAIGRDDADLAADILFPREGWLVARDAPDLGKDWDTHVAAPFRKGVHAFWRRHHDLARAQFASLEVGHAMVQATPKRHGWKESLWIVHGSRLSFVVDGRTHTLPIREMAAWRGAWYVTRLR